MSTRSTQSILTRRTPRLLAALAGLTLVAAVTNVCRAQSWAAPNDGVWSVMANWDPMAVPNGLAPVELGLSKPYLATLNYSLGFQSSLTISNPLATMGIGPNHSVSFNGFPAVNHGSILVNTEASGFASQIILNTDQSFIGNGQIVLNANGGNITTARFVRGSTDPLLTIGAGQTVRGQGLFNDLRVVNNGSIIADRNGFPIVFNGNRTVTNNATLSAINGGSLVFNNTQLISGAGGQFIIGDTSSALLENSASLVSGSVTITGSGVMAVASNHTAFLGTPILNGALHVRDSASLVLTASFTNNGTITVNPTASGFTSSLFVNTDLTIHGTGTVVLNANGGNIATARFVRGSTDPLLTIGAGQTVRGQGLFNDLRVVNHGSIIADRNGFSIAFNGNRAVTNNATLSAINGGTLLFNNTQLISGAGGQISIGDISSALLENSASLVSGTVTTTGSGVMAVASNHTAFLGTPILNGALHVRDSASLVLTASFTNNGTITVNPNASGFTSSLFVNTDLTIHGTGTVVLNANGGNIATARFVRGSTDPLLTIGAGQTVRGQGLFNDLRVVNNGAVIADRDGFPIVFNGNRAVTNNGTLSAINGGSLVFNNTQLISGAGGQFIIGDTSSALLENSASLVSGTVTITGSGVMAVASNHTAILGTPTLNGPLHVRDNASLVLTASFTNNGTITVNPTASGFTSSLFVNTDLTIHGTGTVVLNANGGNIATARFVRGSTDPLLTIGAGQTVRGQGLFNDLRVVNNGAVIADRDGFPLTFNGNRAVTNNGTLSAINGGRLVLSNTQLTHGASGLISVGDGSQALMRDGARIVSGTTTSTGSGVCALDVGQTGFLSQVTLGGPFQVRENASLFLEGPVTLNSTLVVNPPASGFTATLFITTDLAIDGTGTLLLNANSGNIATARVARPGGTPTLTLGPQVTLAGLGNVENVPLVVRGTLAPGGHAGGQVGQLNMTGSSAITMEPTARAVFQIGGASLGQFDRLTSASTIALAGTLRLELVNGYSPSANTTFQIISAAGVTGGFQTLEFGPLPPPKTWVVQYQPSGVRVSIGCNPGDIAFTDATPPGDGSLNNGDFQLFISSFFSAECDGSRLPCNPADIAQTDATPGPDGWVDNGDFQRFITSFFTGEGCAP